MKYLSFRANIYFIETWEENPSFFDKTQITFGFILYFQLCMYQGCSNQVFTQLVRSLFLTRQTSMLSVRLYSAVNEKQLISDGNDF